MIVDPQLKDFLNESMPIWQKNPVQYFREVLQFTPDEWQEEAANDLANFPQVAIKSGQGVGKTGFEAASALWFLTCFENSRVVATAPTRQQLHDVLWSEIAKWQENSPLLREILKWTKTYVYMKGSEQRWFAVARVASKPENMQGFHEDSMLFIVDEASGVRDDIMEAIHGTLTGTHNRLLMCGNPTQSTGDFHDAFTSDRDQYKLHTVNSEDSPRTNKQAINNLIKKYGYDSNVVRVRVRGLFPNQDDDVLIGISLLEQCSDKLFELPEKDEMSYMSIGCDVARYGDDETVICANRFGRVKTEFTKRGQDLMATVGDIVRAYRKMISEFPDYTGYVFAMIDDTGLGGGVTDRLREVKVEEKLTRLVVIPINAAEHIEQDSLENKEAFKNYNNLTTHMWANVKDLLTNKQIQIEDDGILFGQMSARKYRVASNGKIQLESKDDMKKRGLDSPDRGDALALCLYKGKIKKFTGSVPSTQAVGALSKTSYWANH